MRLHLRRGAVALAATATLLLVGSTSASASHFINADSVDGGEIRYENETKYDGALAWGRDRWNAVGKTDLKPDTATTFADLQIQDRNAGKSGPARTMNALWWRE